MVVGPYKRVTGSQQLKHTLHMLLLHGTQVVRSRLAAILDVKELATPTLVRTQLMVHIFPPIGDVILWKNLLNSQRTQLLFLRSFELLSCSWSQESFSLTQLGCQI